MEYECSLAEAAKRLQVDQARVLSALQRGAIATQYRDGRAIVTQGALAEYQARSQQQ